MIIINADDLGRSRSETDAALTCWKENQITSGTAMVFMKDSERAAELVKELGMDVGLHLNLSENFSCKSVSKAVRETQNRIAAFLKKGKYALVMYHPNLRREFQTNFEAQLDEFRRLYGKEPSHIDGHQHKHLCTNMVLDRIIPGGRKVRRNFSFLPGEKSLPNRLYRKVVDQRLAQSYRVTDYYFNLWDCVRAGRLDRVRDLAKSAVVEVGTHPVIPEEFEYLRGREHRGFLRDLESGSYAQL